MFHNLLYFRLFMFHLVSYKSFETPNQTHLYFKYYKLNTRYKLDLGVAYSCSEQKNRITYP